MRINNRVAPYVISADVALRDTSPQQPPQLDRSASSKSNVHTCQETNPADNAGVFSHFFYWWVIHLYKKLHKKKNIEEEFYKAPENLSCKSLGPRLERTWITEVLDAMMGIRNHPRLLCAIFKAFGPSLIALLLGRLLTDAILIGQAVLVERLIENPNGNAGTVYGVCLCLCSALYIFFSQCWTTLAVTTGQQIRVACSCLLYRKILKLPKQSLQNTKVEDLLSSITAGLQQFDCFALYLPFIIVGPAMAALVSCVLWDYLGPTCLVGIAFLVVLIPLQVYTGKKISELTMKAIPEREKRLRQEREIAAGIAQIKQCSWEKLFENRISQIRKKESALLHQATFFHVLISVAYSQGAKIMTLMSITTFVLLGNYFSVSKAFLTICAVHALRIPLCLYFPLGISLAAKLTSTAEKMERFLLLNEYAGRSEQCHHQRLPDYTRVFLKDIYAKWDGHSSQYILQNICLEVQQGELVTVAGPAGGGKSSLLYLLMGELAACRGKMNVNGHCAFCPQHSWIFPSSLRNNIICGHAFNEERFRHILEICELQEDVAMLPEKDMTAIGENGDILLTPIQRVKLNLARAVYQEADIYLLDSPLSAMDLSTAASIFKKCILNFLRLKTVILVTERPYFLKKSDQIIILQDGRMEGCGSFSKLSNGGIQLHHYVEYDKHGELDQEADTSIYVNSKNDKKIPYSNIYSYCRRGSCVSLTPAENCLLNLNLNTEPPYGASTKILKAYIAVAGTPCALITTFLVLILYLVLVCLWDFLFIIWTMNIDRNVTMEHEWFSAMKSDHHYYLIGLWSLESMMVAIGIVMFIVIMYIYNVASTNLYTKLFQAMLYAPIRCLDSLKLGRILYSFHYDMKRIDEYLPSTSLELTQCTVMFWSSVVVIGIVHFWLLIPISIIIALMYLVGNFCLPSIRALKRIQVATMNSAETFFKSSLEGITIVRSHQAEEFFGNEYSSLYVLQPLQDQHSSSLYLLNCSIHAFSLWMGLFSVLCNVSVTLGYRMLIEDVKAPHLGLATYCSLVLSGLIPEAVTYFTNAAMHLASAGAMMDLSMMQKEDPHYMPPSQKEDGESKELPPEWPFAGEIRASNLTLRYRHDEPCVLQNFYFTVKSGEKVGVVGSVGVGKSAILAALVRMVEPVMKGSLWIDDVDITTVPLQVLRKHISAVPRFPVLFSGQLRLNLDPEGKFPDSMLWNVLEKVKMRKAVQTLPYGLQTEGLDWEKVFNIHQRQLMCLARAMLDGNRILLVDVAICNLDSEIEVGMLQVIRRYFSHCTVIIVSHRLRSIMQTDRVIVIEAGKMAESGHPYLLLQNEYSHFYKMVHQTGTAVKNQLIQLAKEAYLGHLPN